MIDFRATAAHRFRAAINFSLECENETILTTNLIPSNHKLEVTRTQPPHESMRNPTWFSVEDARGALAKGREVKYAAELRTVIDRAVEHLSAEGTMVPARTHRTWRTLLRALTFGLVR